MFAHLVFDTDNVLFYDSERSIFVFRSQICFSVRLLKFRVCFFSGFLFILYTMHGIAFLPHFYSITLVFESKVFLFAYTLGHNFLHRK